MLEQVGNRPGMHLDTLRLAQGAAQHHNALVRIRPLAKGQYFLVGVAPHDQRIDRRHVSGIAVVVAGGGGNHQPVQLTALAGDEAIEAGGDVYGGFEGHGAAPLQNIGG
ncbi:hypothetical protein D3C80_1689930 [compost metagenome]